MPWAMIEGGETYGLQIGLHHLAHAECRVEVVLQLLYPFKLLIHCLVPSDSIETSAYCQDHTRHHE